MFRSDRPTTQNLPFAVRLRCSWPRVVCVQSTRETTNSNLPSRTAVPTPGVAGVVPAAPADLPDGVVAAADSLVVYRWAAAPATSSTAIAPSPSRTAYSGFSGGRRGGRGSYDIGPLQGRSGSLSQLWGSEPRRAPPFA